MSDTVIADTNVVSYVLKGSELGLRYAPLLRGRIIAVSFMTVAEMLYGARIADWGPARRDKLEEVLQGFLVLPYDYETCRIWAEVTAIRKRAGNIISCADAWVASSALQHDIPLITHNVRDFAGIPQLKLLSSP